MLSPLALRLFDWRLTCGRAHYTEILCLFKRSFAYDNKLAGGRKRDLKVMMRLYDSSMRLMGS